MPKFTHSLSSSDLQYVCCTEFRGANTNASAIFLWRTAEPCILVVFFWVLFSISVFAFCFLTAVVLSFFWHSVHDGALSQWCGWCRHEVLKLSFDLVSYLFVWLTFQCIILKLRGRRQRDQSDERIWSSHRSHRLLQWLRRCLLSS